MTRDELIKNPSYIIQNVQLSIYTMVDREMSLRNMNRKKMSAFLNISKRQLNKILDGEFDGKLSQLIEIALKLGYTPKIKFNHPIFTKT